jgi:hypothetical protein
VAIPLNDIELRIIGVLIEKALAVPGSYPMTMNLIVLAANQKQNREPVMEYTESEVARALHTLQGKDLVKLAPPAPGARANRFQHNVVEAFHWDKREQALMAELMLRGRQTAGELRTHASRMTPFEDLSGVIAVLDALSKTTPPYVEELPREPGRAANRFRHLLGVVPPEPIASSGNAAVLPTPATPAGAGSSEANPDDLRQRVETLEERVRALEERIRGTA